MRCLQYEVSEVYDEYAPTEAKSNIALITAAQWKNAWNKHGVLDEFYEQTGQTDHTVDAICLGTYVAQHQLGLNAFENIDDIEYNIIQELKSR